jgi:hypothetical protein
MWNKDEIKVKANKFPARSSNQRKLVESVEAFDLSVGSGRCFPTPCRASCLTGGRKPNIFTCFRDTFYPDSMCQQSAVTLKIFQRQSVISD